MLMNQNVRRSYAYGPIPFSSHMGTLLFKPRFPYRELDVSLNSKEQPVPPPPTKSPPPVPSKTASKTINGAPTRPNTESNAKSPTSPTTKVISSPTKTFVSPPSKAVVSQQAKATSPTAKAPISQPTKSTFSAPSNAPTSPPPKALFSPPARAPVSPPARAPVSPPARAPVSPPARAPISPPARAPISPPSRAPISPPSKSVTSPISKPTITTTTSKTTTTYSSKPITGVTSRGPLGLAFSKSTSKSTTGSVVQNGSASKSYQTPQTTKPAPVTDDQRPLLSHKLPAVIDDRNHVPETPKFNHYPETNHLAETPNINLNGVHDHRDIEDHIDIGHDYNHNEHDSKFNERGSKFDESHSKFDGHDSKLYSIQQDHDIAHREEAPMAQTSINAKNCNSAFRAPPVEENRKKFIPTRIMVQEIDEGQPCLSCKGTCPGFRSHCWRKICTHCKCTRESHDVYQRGSSNVFDRIGLKPQSTGMHMSKEMSMVSGYTWVPAGLPSHKIDEYMSQLPNHKVPRLHTPGEKYRNKQLVVQLPRQDLAAAYCKHLSTAAEQRSYEDFVNTRNEMALDIGYVNAVLEKSMECRKCKGVLERNELAVMAPKFGTNVCWHPACFSCTGCDELLVDLTYCIRDGKIFCERHYAELNKPRCAACDELIFAGEYTKAMNQDWHSGHFCCWQCDQTLTGQRYILRDDHPYCIKCYEEVFANSCDECAKPIGIDSKDLSYKDKHWHENCFLCSMCKISLVDKPFGSKNDRIFCASCYDQAFATRCDGCGEIFKAGMKKMEYKGKQWHDKCFCCALCKAPIGTKSFIPKNEEVYCATCYEEKFATRCTKCKKVISSGGVTYKNEPWHKECFCCCNCGGSLAGQRFTSKDEKPYCANCFGELFAKRCTACTQPITGIGGSKFISFEDRHWHNDCFICAQCQTSLVGKGFITDAADILCPECAKARLMAQHA